MKLRWQVLNPRRNIDSDAEHCPPFRGAALSEDSGDLAVFDEYVVGPLDLRLKAVGRDRVRDRKASRQRQQVWWIVED
jgi:hypothetical protein